MLWCWWIGLSSAQEHARDSCFEVCATQCVVKWQFEIADRFALHMIQSSETQVTSSGKE